MKLVIDMQGAQASSRHRGIGRYINAITRAMIVNGKAHDIHIALNGAFTETIIPIRKAFSDLLPTKAIHVFTPPTPIDGANPDNHWRRDAAEYMWEAFIVRLHPDVILIGSLFEGFGDNAVTCLHKQSHNIPTAVILFDLIPLLYPEDYFRSTAFHQWYLNKLEQLKKADLLLSISESSRQEAINHIHFNPLSVINISASVDNHFRKITIDKTTEKIYRTRYKLKNSFIMYTGGIDYRKNVEGLIRSYARIPKNMRESLQLAIICAVSKDKRKELITIAKNAGLKSREIIFTGFIPEEDLVMLYNLCDAFIFPSKHEGFGLPVLEALNCGKAVIASNTSSIPEIINYSEALFDPHDEQSITNAIVKVITDKHFRSSLENMAITQAKMFNWNNSGRIAIQALEEIYTRVKPQMSIAPKRLKLAYISPLPPLRSGISSYSTELLPYLANHYDIVLITNQEVLDPSLASSYLHRDTSWFREHAFQFDRVLYQFGNSRYHEHMVDLLTEIPGIIVLHDFFLSGLLSHMEIVSAKPLIWTKELYISHGYYAIAELEQARDPMEIVLKYPCNLTIIQMALGVITHSELAKRLADKFYNKSSESYWKVIPLLCVPPENIDQSLARQKLKIPADAFIVCSFGYIHELKLNHRLVEAWENTSLAKNKQCFLFFVGEVFNEYGEKLLYEKDNETILTNIHITGWTDQDTFHDYLQIADVAVQLRAGSNGETSKAVLDCMNYGIATIVNDHGSLREIADDCVWKIPENFETHDLVNALETLWQDENTRLKLGSKGKDQVRKKHNPALCAELYFNMIEETYQTSNINTDSIMKNIASLPIENDNQIKQIAAAMTQFTPSRQGPAQIFIDISALMLGSSMKKAADLAIDALITKLLLQKAITHRVELVYFNKHHECLYARKFSLHHLKCRTHLLIDEPIEYYPHDIFITFKDSKHGNKAIFYQQLRNYGVTMLEQETFAEYQNLLTLLNENQQDLFGFFEKISVNDYQLAES